MEHGNYLGAVSSGKRLGIGNFSYANGDDYVGEWVDDERSGIGKQLFYGGDVYEGEWYRDLRHGKGKLLYKGGAAFDGVWQLDEPLHGRGSYRTTDGIFEGEWKDGKPGEVGKLHTTNSNGNTITCHRQHSGRCEWWTVLYSNGHQYEGELIIDSVTE